MDHQSHPGVSQGQGSGRALPDLATNADPESGYLLYEPSFAGLGLPDMSQLAADFAG